MIRRAFKLKPDNGYIADSLGWLYFKQGKMSLAIKYLGKAANILPDDPTIAEHLGDAYTRAGLFKKALKTYRHALKFNHRNNILKKKLKQTIEKLKR
jgi:tetratricopeptide (TPR) repeat protein